MIARVCGIEMRLPTPDAAAGPAGVHQPGVRFVLAHFVGEQLGILRSDATPETAAPKQGENVGLRFVDAHFGAGDLAPCNR